MTDSTGQRQHYEANKERYKQPERAVATIIETANDDVLRLTNATLKTTPYQLRRAGPAVAFGPNETAIPANQREMMYQLLVTMVRNPDYLVEVSGAHATGEADSVSAGRIRSVVNSLTRSGVALSRIMEKDNKSFGNTATSRQVTFQYFSTNKQDVAKAINASKPNSVTITEGIFARGANAYLDAFPWKTTTTTTPDGNKLVQVIITRIDPPRLKTFNEARGTVINEYQAILEKQWLATLRQRYPVKVNEDEMRKLMK
jgi:peptidyl-prolyl cis-trans isomerase SurA